MKKIAVTGNIGKTTTIELLFQYLTLKEKRCVLFCTNGSFDNYSNFVNRDAYSKVSNRRYQEILEQRENDCDYCLIEMTEESAYIEGLLINQAHFDLVINVNYDPKISSFHIADYPDFGFKFLNELDTEQLIMYQGDQETYHLQRPYTTFNDFTILNSSFNGTSFQYEGITYNTSLINKHIIRSLAAATKGIETLNEFDNDIYNQFLASAFIRGRFEKHIIGNKNIIIDTGWNGIDNILKDIQEENIFTPINQTTIIFVPHPHILPTSEQAIQGRKAKALYLKDNNIDIVLTNSLDGDNTLNYFEAEFVNPTDYQNYNYIANNTDALEYAFNSDRLNILILGSYATRYFRHLIEEKEQENNENEEIVE